MRRPDARGDHSDDAGFTMVEILVATVLMGVLGALSVAALVNYQRTADVQGSADDLVSTLRTMAQRSVTEGRTYCVRFDTSASTYTVYRSTCEATSTVVIPAKKTRGPALLSSPAFSPADPADDVCPTGDDCAYFYPRGTGSPGSVVVQRPGRESITITIEGLTSRVVRS